MPKSPFKVGPRYKFKRQEFWAEGGQVCIEDQDCGDFKVLSRAEAAARAVGLNKELSYIQYPSQRTELSNCVVNLCEACKEAKRQGDPDDIEVRKQRIKDWRKVSMITGMDGTAPAAPKLDVSGFTPISKYDLGLIMTADNVKNDRFSKLRI